MTSNKQRVQRIQRLQALRRSNAAQPIPSGRRYKRRPKHAKQEDR